MYPANDYRGYLQHSAKGTHWKSGHKYKYIKNGRYYYDDEVSGNSSSVGSKFKSAVGKVSSAMNSVKDKTLGSVGKTAASTTIDRGNVKRKDNSSKDSSKQKKPSAMDRLKAKYKKALTTTKRNVKSAGNQLKQKANNAKKAIKSAPKRAATAVWKKADVTRQKSKARLRKLAKDILRPARQRINRAKLNSARRSIKRTADEYSKGIWKTLGIKAADKYRVTNRATWKNRDRDKTDYHLRDGIPRPKPSKKVRRKSNVNRVVRLKAHKRASGGGITTTRNGRGGNSSSSSSRKF